MFQTTTTSYLSKTHKAEMIYTQVLRNKWFLILLKRIKYKDCVPIHYFQVSVTLIAKTRLCKKSKF